MRHAVDYGFVIFTHDLDFGRLLALQDLGAPSVLQVRTQDVLPDAIGRVVIAALRTCTNELELGALVTVDPNGRRIRLLPIRR
jgi:predicted nuclease of predicted toxin-antitoxin system